MQRHSQYDPEKINRLKAVRNAARVAGNNVTTAEGLQALLEVLSERLFDGEKQQAVPIVERLSPQQVNDVSDQFIKIDDIIQTSANDSTTEKVVNDIIIDVESTVSQVPAQIGLNETLEKVIGLQDKDPQEFKVAEHAPEFVSLLQSTLNTPNDPDFYQKFADTNQAELTSIFESAQEIRRLQSQENLDVYQIELIQRIVGEGYPWAGVKVDSSLGHDISPSVIEIWGQNTYGEAKAENPHILEERLTETIVAIRGSDLGLFKKEDALKEVVRGYARQSGLESFEYIAAAAQDIPLTPKFLTDFQGQVRGLSHDSDQVNVWLGYDDSEIKEAKIPESFGAKETLLMNKLLKNNEVVRAVDLGNAIIESKVRDLLDSYKPFLYQSENQNFARIIP